MFDGMKNLFIQKTLVGYDGSEQSERVLQRAININNNDDDTETEIHIALVVREPSGMANPIPDEVLESLHKRGQESLLNADRLVRKSFLKQVTHIDIGNPAEKLIGLADRLKPQLVVLGISRHPSSESLIGTVSSHFIKSRRYMILLVP
jgi:nucleotide-binding universal stress UspA family protein